MKAAIILALALAAVGFLYGAHRFHSDISPVDYVSAGHHGDGHHGGHHGPAHW